MAALSLILVLAGWPTALFGATAGSETRRIAVTARSADGCYFPNPATGPLHTLRIVSPPARAGSSVPAIAHCSTRTCFWAGCPLDQPSVEVLASDIQSAYAAAHAAAGTDHTSAGRTPLSDAERRSFWSDATAHAGSALTPRDRQQSDVEKAAYGTRRLHAAHKPDPRRRWDLYVYSGAYGSADAVGHTASGLGTRLDIPYALATSVPSQLGARAAADVRRVEYTSAPIEVVVDTLAATYGSAGVIRDVQAGRFLAAGSPAGVVDGASLAMRLGGARSPVDLKIDGGLIPTGYALAPRADIKTASAEASYAPLPTTDWTANAYSPWAHISAGSRLMWADAALDPSLEWLEAHGYAGPFAAGGYLSVRSGIHDGTQYKPILPEQANGWASWSFRRPVDIELASSWMREIDTQVTRRLYPERTAPGDLTHTVTQANQLGPAFWSSDLEISGRTGGRWPMRWYTRAGHESYGADLALAGAAGIRLLGWPRPSHSVHLYTRGRWGSPWSLASGGISDAIYLARHLMLAPSVELGWRARAYISKSWMSYQAFRLGLTWSATDRLSVGADALLTTGAYGPVVGDIFASLNWRLLP